MRNKRFKSQPCGQVMLAGIVMLLILLLILLYAFDIHNIIRAKFKVETAQEAAAMAGANWQKETLNLIGELNLFKATALILEDSPELNPPVPSLAYHNDAETRKRRKKALQARLDLLTEAQTRISFIVPLVGLAAAQQAAKANGLSGKEKFDTYLELLDSDKRYVEEFGGAPRLINHYAWKGPYREMVKTISDNGIAIFPNARITGFPHTFPSCLSYESFYQSILYLAKAIAKGEPAEIQLCNFCESVTTQWDDSRFFNRWWIIDYNSILFPKESEIFTVGVEFDAEYDEKIAQLLRENFIGHPEFYPSAKMLPGNMAWCRYDEWWYPQYYKDRYASYEESHFKYWFEQQVLRKPVKAQYRYEGPAAYAEGYADVGSVVNLRIRQGSAHEAPKGNSTNSKVLLGIGRQNKAEIFERTPTSRVRVGTRRSAAQDSRVDTAYRPGAIAKPLGELKENQPPITLPLVLPVFNRISVMPTYMPIPYNFQVLKPGYAPLEKFLSWLAEQNSLDGTPPAGTEHYLLALQFFVYGVADRAKGIADIQVPCLPGNRVSGRGLRYYYFNPHFDRQSFEDIWRNLLYDWPKFRDEWVFRQKNFDKRLRLSPGFRQEPQLFWDDDNVPLLTEVTFPDGIKREVIAISNKFRDKRKLKKKKDINGKTKKLVDDNYKDIAIMDLATHRIIMEDSFGKKHIRVYLKNTAHSRTSPNDSYYVIDSENHIIPNCEYDPTLFYNQYKRPDHCGGNGHFWNPGGFDDTPGPARL